jgi:hypothetical protein
MDKPPPNLSGSMDNNSDQMRPPPAFIAFDIFHNISIICVGFFGIICSTLVIIVIIKNKELQSPCFKLIASGAIGSVNVAVQFVTLGIVRLIEPRGIFLTGLNCLFLFAITGLFGALYHALITFLVGIDRFLSIAFPIRYRKFGDRYFLILFCTSTTFVIVIVVAGFVSGNLHTSNFCIGFTTVLDESFSSAFAALNLIFSAAIVFAYALIFICFALRSRHLKKNGATSSYETFMNTQKLAMPTVKLMFTLYIILGILPEIIISIGVNYDYMNMLILGFRNVGAMLKTCSSLVEFISLSICSKKFRKCLKDLLRVNKTTTVVPFFGS